MAGGRGERERGNGVEKIRDPLSFGGERNDAGCCTFASMMVQGAWIIGHFLFDISNLALETIDKWNNPWCFSNLSTIFEPRGKFESMWK